MLSFAEAPILSFEVPLLPFVEVLAVMGVPLVDGVAEGMLFELEELAEGVLEEGRRAVSSQSFVSRPSSSRVRSKPSAESIQALSLPRRLQAVTVTEICRTSD